MSTKSTTCATSMMRLLGNRSASVPATGVSNKVGRNMALVTKPRALSVAVGQFHER